MLWQALQGMCFVHFKRSSASKEKSPSLPDPFVDVFWITLFAVNEFVRSHICSSGINKYFAYVPLLSPLSVGALVSTIVMT